MLERSDLFYLLTTTLTGTRNLRQDLISIVMAIIEHFPWLVSFVLVNIWSPTVMAAANQKSALFTAVKKGQIPTSGMTRLKIIETRSLVGCSDLCLNHNAGGSCKGFVFQSASCVNSSSSTTKIPRGTCETMQFTDIASLVFGSANSTCQQFYASSSADSSSSSPVMGPQGFQVYAVLSFNDKLFVVGSQMPENSVVVYDTTSFLKLSNIIVPAAVGFSNNLLGLAIRQSDSSLFIGDYSTKRIYKVNQLATNPTLTNDWQLPSNSLRPAGLSVNRQGNLLMASYESNNGRLEEFSTTGSLSLVRVIMAEGNMMWQAVELNDGTLAVSSFGSWHGVRVISATGSVLRSYGSTTAGSGPGQMSSPQSLAVDSQGFILVADSGNKRILVLNPTLTAARTLISNETIANPLGLWLDESRRRLYVGECSGQNRVLVFDNIPSCSSLFNP